MGIGWAQLLIVLGIVILIFGTKKLRNLGGDIGGAIKSFKSAVKEGNEAEQPKVEEKPGRVIEGEAQRKEDEKHTG